MECRHFGVCGSCRLNSDSYEGQLEKKREELSDLFKALYDDTFYIACSQESHYRARAEFKVWHKGDALHYAMNSLNRDGMVLIEQCPMVAPPIEKLMWPLLETIEKSKALGEKLFGIDFLSSINGDMVVSMLYHRKLDETWQNEAELLAMQFNISIIGRSRKQKVVIGNEYVIDSIDVQGRSYRFKQIENSFTQPNPGVN
ncbi:MAG TPA: tRNA (uridine(54)-C5)-methyltransferase TrmA, partial [Sulfuricurvum sp.]|nr:tRNA (uridine(54)-C5)-methyltransferase TrmA [Sulfuricurvum sp.]